MKIFFRKHGNSLFYIFLPVFLLLLTVAFIQFTPRISKTAPGDACNENKDCCTTSGCGSDTAEVCDSGHLCKRTNVGCVTGTVNDSINGCTCEVDGQPIGSCVVCAIDEAFLGGACERICGPNEDPATTGCISLNCINGGGGINNDGTKTDCTGSACSLNPRANSQPMTSALYLAGMGLLAAAWFKLRSKRAH